MGTLRAVYFWLCCGRLVTRRRSACCGRYGLNVTTGIELVKTDRFLRKMGFRQTGGNYVLEGVKG